MTLDDVEPFQVANDGSCIGIKIKVVCYDVCRWSMVAQWLGHWAWNLRVVSSILTGPPQ